MYLIALCDDEKAELAKTEQMLSAYEKRHSDINFIIECFENADELLCMIRKEKYVPDIIFMDIYMPEIMGIDAAKELRIMGIDSRIVFLTTSREHALEAFGVNASQYLVKPISEKVLYPLLDKLLDNTEEERKKNILLRIDGRIKRLALNDIAYFEAQGKAQCIYLSNGTQFIQYITMAKIYDMISRYQEFVRVGAAYIVNLEHVDSMNAQDLQMDNGKKIYLPRGSYQPLREKYFDYFCGGDKG